MGSSKHFLIVAVSLGGMTFTATGCSGSSSDNSCQTDADCVAGYVCQANECVLSQVTPTSSTGASTTTTSSSTTAGTTTTTTGGQRTTTSSSSSTGARTSAGSTTTAASTTTTTASTTTTTGGTPSTTGTSGSSTGGSTTTTTTTTTTGGSTGGTDPSYCQTCQSDSDCGGTDNAQGVSSDGDYCLCTDQTCTVTFCGTACQSQSDCISSASCQAIQGLPGGGNLCVPVSGTCPATTGGTTNGGTSSGNTSTGGSTTGGTTGTSVGDGGPFVTIPLNGCPPLDYQGAVTIGGQTFQLEVDTGSTDTAVALSTCGNCSVTPEYSPASGVCSSQTTSSQFGSGSWNAEVCSTTVQVGGEMPDVTIDFGGITSQTQFFQNATCDSLVTGQQNPSPYQGILGLGPIDLDTIGQSNDDAYFNELVANGVTDTMATLLCSSGGLLWFGGYDPQYATAGASVQYTPMTNSGYWSVSLSGIGLGTTSLGGADTNAIVDTGTGAFLMGASAISSLESQLASNSGATSTFGSGALGSSFFNGGINCIQPTGGQTTAQIDAALPPMTLTFPTASGGSFTLNMPATQSYLVPITSGSTTVYCAGVGSNAGIGATIIGGPALRAYITVFDEGNQQVGFIQQSYCG